MGKRREKKLRKRGFKFFIIEGHKLNEKTGKLEPYSKKVYYDPHGC